MLMKDKLKKIEIKKYYIVLAVFFLVFGCICYWLNNYQLEGYQPLNSSGLGYEKAKVLEVVDSNLSEDSNTSSGYRGTQELKLEITSGENKGEIVDATNYLTRTHNILADEGSELIVTLDENNVGYHVSVYNYSQANTIYFMLGFFALLMIVVGGRKGFKTLIGLIFSFSCIIFFTVPMIFNGYSPILISIITAVLIALVSLMLLEGMTKKVIVALAGTAAGVIGAGLVFIFFSRILGVSGYNLADAEVLFMIHENTGLQVRDVLFAGVLIAAVGAVVDVAMSIASTLHELHEHNPALKANELFKSGINVGQDLIGTMADTLILAYAGGSFSTMLLYMAYAVNYNQLINLDSLVLEIAQALAGSIGIVLCVPFVAFIGGKVFAGQKIINKPAKIEEEIQS